MYIRAMYHEIFFLAYHLNQNIYDVKCFMTPLERKFYRESLFDQKDKEYQEMNKK